MKQTGLAAPVGATKSSGQEGVDRTAEQSGNDWTAECMLEILNGYGAIRGIIGQEQEEYKGPVGREQRQEQTRRQDLETGVMVTPHWSVAEMKSREVTLDSPHGATGLVTLSSPLGNRCLDHFASEVLLQSVTALGCKTGVARGLDKLRSL